MSDGRRTLGDISRAVNNFDRNPSRVIFGGGSSSTNAQAAQPAPAPAPAASGQRRQ
jgi:phospholipid/cholesterol/gamma-HCH transport system substrate-binding protein